jgi:hypothetical protein
MKLQVQTPEKKERRKDTFFFFVFGSRQNKFEVKILE